MSSNIESVVAGANTPNVDPVELSDEDNVELNEEANDMVDETIDNEGDGSKRKKTGKWLRNMSVCTARKNMHHKVHEPRHISCDT
ncbi:hypothetical protein Hanom_Chr00s002555g01701631 [Helianthus anomalus]